jgi:hypothetical protein
MREPHSNCVAKPVLWRTWQLRRGLFLGVGRIESNGAKVYAVLWNRVYPRPERYDAAVAFIPTCYSIFTCAAMTFLWRFLIVLPVALLFAQGAFAHEHMTSPVAGAMRMQMQMQMQMKAVSNRIDVQDVMRENAHCAEMAATGMPCRHDCLFCCSTSSCGAHCGALLVAFRFEPRVAGRSLPRPLSEPQRTGVTHAPLLRPPIV